MDLKTEIREYFYTIHGSHIETDIANIIAIAEKHISLQLKQTGVNSCCSDCNHKLIMHSDNRQYCPNMKCTKDFQ